MAEAVVEPIIGAKEIGQMVRCNIKINDRTWCQVEYPKGVDGKRAMSIHRLSIHSRLSCPAPTDWCYTSFKNTDKNINRHLKSVHEEFFREEEEKKKKLSEPKTRKALDNMTDNRKRNDLDGKLVSLTEENARLKVGKDDATAEIKTLKEEKAQHLQEIEGLKKVDAQHVQEIIELKAQLKKQEHLLRQQEKERRLLHEKLQELKGNIRVFCRIRSIIPSDKMPGGIIKRLKVLNDKSLEVHKPNDTSKNAPASGKGSSKIDFKFDRVFGPNATQQQVFDEISQLIQSALDGYNVCIFAYGQTGSGKTFTMEGGTAGSESDGMIPRSVRLIFAACESLRAKGWAYKIEASFLEIYNEQIRDLLGPSGGVHDIRIDNNETFVTNLKVEELTNEQQVQNLLAKAQQRRAVAATSCNEHSSRSHSVLRLKLTGVNANNETSKGNLYLIDLAGSERLKESGATGDRLTETKHINKSLSALSNVIMALAAKESHIPYRNSKLTFLLQQALGGSAKTLMFVNLSPKENCIDETINSLRFAEKVNACHIGTAMKNS